MSGSRVVVLVALVALVVGVLLVRPSTATDPSAGDPAGAASGATAGATAGGPRDAGPPRGPWAFAGLRTADVALGVDGAEGLRLGTAQADLVAAGWEPREAEHGCARIGPARTADRAALSGWVRDGRLVSVQVLAARQSAPTGLEVSLGQPVGEVRAAGDAAPARDRLGVRTLTWPVGDRTVVASDLATGTVRWVEVRTDAGAACELDPRLVGGVPPDLVAAEVDRALRDLEVLTPAAWEDLLGSPVGVLDPARVTGRSEPAPGCERVELDGSFVDVHDGAVVLVGEVRGGRDGARSRTTWRTEAGAPPVRQLERVDLVPTVRVRGDGVRLAADFAVRSAVPTGVDAFAVTVPPRLLAVQVGLGCPSALPFS